MNVRTCTRCGSDFLGLAAPGSGSLCPKCRLVAAHPGAPAAAHEAPPAIPRALPSASAPRPVPTPAPAAVPRFVQVPAARIHLPSMNRVVERASAVLLALLITALFAWMAQCAAVAGSGCVCW